MIITGNKEYYKGIDAINYEGKESDNPFSFKFYNPEQLVMGKTTKCPVAIIRDYSFDSKEQGIQDLIRPENEDLFK